MHANNLKILAFRHPTIKTFRAVVVDVICAAPGFQLRIIDANDPANLVKRIDFGQICINMGRHLENIAMNH
jgi:hypothetical protein